MAEILPSIPRKYLSTPERYPWEEWTDGQTRKILRGIDYPGDTAVFRQALRNRAKTLRARTGKQWRVETASPPGQDGIIFRFRVDE